MELEHCPICGIGRLHAIRHTVARVYGETLIHMPNIPAQQCDMCGQIFHDERALHHYEILIGESGPPPNVHHAGDRVASSTQDDSADAATPAK